MGNGRRLGGQLVKHWILPKPLKNVLAWGFLWLYFMGLLFLI